MRKILLFTLFLSQSLLSLGQWSGNSATNTPVFVGDGDQNYTGSIVDGLGGVIISWESVVEVTPATSPITYRKNHYVQKLSSAGVKQWTANGVKVSDLSNASSNSYIISDGSGGVIIAWDENETGSSDNIYVQRIDASGNRLWGNNGIAISTLVGSQNVGGIIADGSGGAVITWTDEATFGASKIYAQRVNSSGAIQWTASGVPVSDNIGFNSGGYIYSDTAGGYVIVWEEEIDVATEDFEGSKIYWQKLNANGSRQAASNSLIFDFPPSDLAYTGVIGAAPDGSGGIYVALSAENDNSADLYLQHVLSNGTKAFGSNQLGLLMDASVGTLITGSGFTYVNYSVAIASDNQGGVVLGWSDTRAAKNGYYAQRVNAAGTKLWGTNDLTLAPEGVGASGISSIVISNDGDFVFDISKGPDDFSETSLYAQKVSPAGILQYGTNGIAVATSSGFKYGQIVALNDKVVFVWSDSRAGDSGTMTDIYSQSVFTSGVLPVHFLDFSAAYSNGKTELSWTTASENNNAYFVVEKSQNGSDFLSISSIKGAGTSSQLKNYNYTDAEALSSSGILYYRIKQIDNDGKFDYSQTKAVKVPALKNVSVSYFPNPVIDKLIVEFKEVTNTPLIYSLADISGKVLLKTSGTTTLGQIQINMENFPAGVYLLNIESEGKTLKEKIIKN